MSIAIERLANSLRAIAVSLLKCPFDAEYNKFVINSLEELNRYHFNYHPVEIKIENLMKQLSVGSYNLRPYYQRTEVMNTELSSKIIESLLLGIEIPYLLVYDKLENGNYITEVVDGQQRILAILGFLQREFKNEQGKLERSKKMVML